MMKRYMISISLLLSAVVVLHPGCRESGNRQAAAGAGNAPAVADGIVLQPGMLENNITSTGTILANEDVEIRSEISGRIVSISFTEGSFVKKGDTLLRIDDRELKAQEKRLELDQKLADEDLYRKEKLFEMKAVSQEELNRAVNQSGVISAQLELIRAQLSKAAIIAPFSGKIGLRQVSPGGYISSSTFIARLIQDDPVRIEFTLPERHISQLNQRSRISFRVSGIDSSFAGEVYAVEPVIDPSTRSVTIRALSTNHRYLLVPGAFAQVEISLERIPDALNIPSEAIIPQLSGKKVLICRDGKVESRVITTGIRTDQEVQVTTGLQPGDTVLTSGLLMLRDGMNVKVRLP
jgi:membrane fusion protein (multidrug efflux system)